MSFWEVSHNLLNNYFSEHLPVTASDVTWKEMYHTMK